MPPILKRILVNGLLAAGTLAVVGVGFAELASLMIAAKGPVDAGPAAESLSVRVPAMMALWGFLFVALGELALQWWRSFKAPVQPAASKTDPAEVLLEQIMNQVEAKQDGAEPSSASSAARIHSGNQQKEIDWEACEKHGHSW